MYVFLTYLAIMVIIGIIYKIWQSTSVAKQKSAARHAIEEENYDLALDRLKKALKTAEGNARNEREILNKIAQIYDMHGINYSFNDFEELLRQTEMLEGKTSSKAIRSSSELALLKQKIIDKMPSLTI